MGRSKKILLTGARSLFTLDLARRFHEEGHQIFVAETSLHHVCRFSNAVEKSFVVPSPRFEPEGFISELAQICESEKIDMLIPMWEEIFCLSNHLDRFPKSCTVFTSSYETLNTLHNKWLFNKKLEELGFPAPKSYLVHSQEELDALSLDIPYILKPSYSRAALKIQKVTSKVPPQVIVDPHNPLVAQEFLHGKKYCSYSVAHEGKLTAHTVYPVDFSIDGNSCLNFEAIAHPKIEEWVQSFVKKAELTGQFAFDFIEQPDGSLYAIECNPRGTSGLHLFQKSNHISHAFLDPTSPCITPTLGYSKQIAWGMLLYGWKTRRWLTFMKKFFTLKDIVFSKEDLAPFFYQPILFFFYVVKSLRLRTSLPAMFTFDTDWNGQYEEILPRSVTD